MKVLLIEVGADLSLDQLSELRLQPIPLRLSPDQLLVADGDGGGRLVERGLKFLTTAQKIGNCIVVRHGGKFAFQVRQPQRRLLVLSGESADLLSSLVKPPSLEALEVGPTVR